MQFSDEEMKLISYFRHNFVDNNFSYHFCSNEYFLRFWEQAKSEHLFKLFNGNLVLTKEVTFKKTSNELSNSIEDLLKGKNEKKTDVFVYYFNNFIKSYDFAKLFSSHNEYNYARVQLSSLLSVEDLVNNIYSGDTVSIPFPDEKEYVLQKGCKTMRALSKIAQAFNIEGFEDFRLCHSLIFNDKDIKGELSLSIHPLDYITMSYNSSNWDSCLNWEDGIYRLGATEMMNSPCVVVAYLSSKTPMSIDNFSWNNKKWRQLFVVNKDIIAGIKGYPYHNGELTKTAIKWIKELAKENLNWEYREIEKTQPYELPVILPNGEESYINAISGGYMYNDWGTIPYHFVACGESIKYSSHLIDYSGITECVVCGETGDFYAADSLVCLDCEPHSYCELCGEEIEEKNTFVVDDHEICQVCFEDRAIECCACGEYHLDNNIAELVVFNEHGNRTGLRFWICDDEDCLDMFAKEFLNENAYPLKYADKCYGVYWDELNVETQVNYFGGKYLNEG